MQAVVTVFGNDKVGIVSSVATTLANAGANILDINQTILRGNFSMMMLVDVPDFVNFGDLQTVLDYEGRRLGLAIHAQNTAIFDAMHKL